MVRIRLPAQVINREHSKECDVQRNRGSERMNVQYSCANGSGTTTEEFEDIWYVLQNIRSAAREI